MFNVEKLITALNKYFRPVTEKEYWYEWDIPMTNHAVEIAEFPKHVIERIWTKKLSDGFREHLKKTGKIK